MKPTAIIWGIGERTKLYAKYEYFKNCMITAYIDSDGKTDTFQGKPVYPPARLPELMEHTDWLIICNRFFSEIFTSCLTLGIPRHKIITTDWIEEPFAAMDMEAVTHMMPKLEEELNLNRYKLIEMNESDLYDENRLVGKGKFSHALYMSDYFRYRSFEFLAEQILEDQAEGAVAEFGVFKGEFSALINEKFPTKKLYLFDTFEGFDPKELERETGQGRCDDKFAEFHANTSLEKALGNLPHPEQCVVCKGFFPQSVSEEARKESYAFVSIDVDFEDSIYAGLEFFYPRPSEHGAIFLHDYHSAFLKGVKAAVGRYEQVLGYRMKKVPLADRAGTLVILK